MNEILKFDDTKNVAELISEIKTNLYKRGIPEEAHDIYIAHRIEAHYWKHQEEKATPIDVIEARKGSDGKFYEYFGEEYTISELNRLYPGWWNEGMRSWYEPSIQTCCTEGYLMVNYPTLSGKANVRKIYAIGASQVLSSKDDSFKPSQPDDRFKAARTEWIKLAGKWLCIGLDIYHQQITAQLRSNFEDRIRGWELYASYWKDVAKNVETGKAFRDMLRIMPTAEESQRLLTALEGLPSSGHQKILEKFSKQSHESKESSDRLKDIIYKVEQASITYNKQKEQDNE